MAFDATKMHCSFSGNPRQWMYKSAADLVTGANYFDSFASQLNVLDVIVSIPDAGTPVMYAVTDITSGVVTIA